MRTLNQAIAQAGFDLLTIGEDAQVQVVLDGHCIDITQTQGVLSVSFIRGEEASVLHDMGEVLARYSSNFPLTAGKPLAEILDRQFPDTVLEIKELLYTARWAPFVRRGASAPAAVAALSGWRGFLAWLGLSWLVAPVEDVELKRYIGSAVRKAVTWGRGKAFARQSKLAFWWDETTRPIFITLEYDGYGKLSGCRMEDASRTTGSIYSFDVRNDDDLVTKVVAYVLEQHQFGCDSMSTQFLFDATVQIDL